MRLFKRLGILLGSLHIVLYFLIPDYFSLLDSMVPTVIAVPFMFVIGYLWPLLVFFAFAPRRFYDEPETQKYILEFGRLSGLRVQSLTLRIVSLVLLWPFSLANFFYPYLFHRIGER